VSFLFFECRRHSKVRGLRSGRRKANIPRTFCDVVRSFFWRIRLHPPAPSP